jgi:hypothetical protein
MNNNDDLKEYIKKNIDNQNKILEKLESIEKDNMMMKDHIVFVNSVYNRIKAPFFYIMNMVELISFEKSISHKTIPKIE